MGWRKQGFVFAPDGSIPWMRTHAQVPTAFAVDDVVRVLIATRDDRGRARVGVIDLARDDLTRVVRVHETPALDFGAPGTFDEDGVMPSEVLPVGDELWMYYSGWNQKVSTPYHNATGLAVSVDGGRTFRRKYEGPVLERTAEEPHLAVTPTVVRDGDRFLCWYISGLRWIDVKGHREPVYAIKHAFSEDGVHWVRPPKLCIDQRHEKEAFSRPCVRKSGSGWEMWYCFRDSVDFRDGSGSYRLGYATSTDGENWVRRDNEIGITVSEDGWDSTMICYPFVFDVDGTKYMVHNGNGFGRTGFGVSRWEQR
jgi:hypothetical protein